MTNQRGLGWLPDVPKLKDYDPHHSEVFPILEESSPSLTAELERLALGEEPGPLPANVDLRKWFSPIDKQGALNCCTAHTTVALVEYFERRGTGKHVDASTLFVYKTSRNLLGLTGDSGAHLRTAMGALVLFGAPPEKYWPYAVEKFDVEPTPFVYAFGQNYKAVKYFRLDPGVTSVTQILHSVKLFAAYGFPSMFGFPVFEEYQALAPGNLILLPTPNSMYSGGHANVVAGYDNDLVIGGEPGALLVRNSFGEDWGDHGYAWMPYAYITRGLTADWWTMTSLDWVNLEAF